MGQHGPGERVELEIPNAEFLARLPYDVLDVGIVDVTHLPAKVVFDLVVEAAQTPGEQPILRREVSRGFDLVNRP